MADEYYEGLSQSNPFNFLGIPEIKTRFAKLNRKLLRGRHIQLNTDPTEYALLSQSFYFNKLHFFYQQLYNLELYKRSFSPSEICFYLDFRDSEGTGLNSDNNSIPLTPTQTKFGLMVLNMFYEKFLERVKQITWAELEEVIMHSERQEDYKRIFLGSVRDDYTDRELDDLKRIFSKTLKRFDELGWVSATDLKGNFSFIINVSIRRLEDMYRDELQNPDAFFSQLKKQNNKLNTTNDVS